MKSYKSLSPCHSLLRSCNKMLDSELIISSRSDKLHEFVSKLQGLKTDLMLDEQKFVYLLNMHANKLGKTVLHEAVQANRLENVEYLLKVIGVDADAFKHGDWTPFMLAAAKNYKQIIELLIKFGASLCLQNKDGWDAFHIACRSCDLETVKYLWQSYPDQEYARNIVSKNGRSPLHTAVIHGRNDTVQFLVNDAHFSLDHYDSCGCTPLMDAFRNGNIQTAQFILSHKNSTANCIDKQGRNVLHICCEGGRLECVQWILQNLSIHIDSKAENSRLTPVHFCAKEGHASLLKYLHARGGSLEAVDGHGRSALHHAAAGGSPQCISYLLRAGVHDSVDSCGYSAKDFAKNKNVLKIFDKFSGTVQ